jgi:hypothetical protein
MKEINNPLEAKIDRSNGNIEISIAKKFSDTEEAMYKSFMSVCAMQDKALVDTSKMDDDETMKACGMQYDKMRAMLNQSVPSQRGIAQLTDKQKKLPPALQKAILKKMKEEGKITEEESEAAYSKLLSETDKQKEEVGPHGEMKVVENPKEPKISDKKQK